MSNKWSAKTWSGLTEFSGRNVWVDGEYVYYSDGSTAQKVLNKATSTWGDFSWGDINPTGECMLVNDGNIYFLPSDSAAGYYLNKSTSAWVSATFVVGYNTVKLDGRYIFKIGSNHYYAKDSTKGYRFNPTGKTVDLESVEYNYIIDGRYVWSDGENTYYSKGTAQYVYTEGERFIFKNLKTWNGLTNFDGDKVWTDGENIYYSADGTQYILDKATSTWTEQTWTGLTSFSGNDIWSDGTDTYYSNAANQYMLGEPAPTEVYLSKITLPVKVDGVTSSVEFTLKDAEARGMIEDLGHALYWMGVTTTVMSDGLTTADVVIDGETVTPEVGGLVSYSGSEFVWNGTAWQEMGKNNFGALAFKSSATASYTPAGTVSITKGEDATTSFTPFGSAGTRATASWEITGETATFSFNPGTLPSAGTAVDLVTGSSTDTATFSGTQATITAE